jgi:hypothetical protein
LGFGGVPSVGVPERRCDENIARKLIVGTEAADFLFKERAPFGGKAILISFLGFTQTELASIVLGRSPASIQSMIGVCTSALGQRPAST